MEQFLKIDGKLGGESALNNSECMSLPGTLGYYFPYTSTIKYLFQYAMSMHEEIPMVQMGPKKGHVHGKHYK